MPTQLIDLIIVNNSFQFNLDMLILTKSRKNLEIFLGGRTGAKEICV